MLKHPQSERLENSNMAISTGFQSASNGATRHETKASTPASMNVGVQTPVMQPPPTHIEPADIVVDPVLSNQKSTLSSEHYALEYCRE